MQLAVECSLSVCSRDVCVDMCVVRQLVQRRHASRWNEVIFSYAATSSSNVTPSAQWPVSCRRAPTSSFCFAASFTRRRSVVTVWSSLRQILTSKRPLTDSVHWKGCGSSSGFHRRQVQLPGVSWNTSVA